MCIAAFGLKRTVEDVSDLSSLTKTQVETLKIQHLVSKGAISVQKAIEMRKTGGVSKGTHYRILAQARRNIRRSLFTVGVAAQLDLVRIEDVEKLLLSVSKIPADVDQGKVPEILALVNAVAERIVIV